MSLTPKREKFVQAYVETGNASEASARSGHGLTSNRDGFYVYFLIDDGHIFYVGKGKGDRITHHRKEATRDDRLNHVKSARILEAVAAGTYEEAVFASNLSEFDALKIEKSLIERFRTHGLTNISSGNVHPLESQIARIDAILNRIIPFEDWVFGAKPYVWRWADQHGKTMREVYDSVVVAFLELRSDFEAKLNLIKGNQNGAARG